MGVVTSRLEPDNAILERTVLLEDKERSLTVHAYAARAKRAPERTLEPICYESYQSPGVEISYSTGGWVMVDK